MIPAELLTLLRCPETMQALAMASPEQLSEIEAARVAGTLRDRAGNLIREPVTVGLVCADGKLLYPIRDGLPVLLSDDALPLGAA